MHVPVTVSIDGIKEKKTQILFLLTFKDALIIQKKLSENKFGFSKFAELRPKEIEFENSFVCIFA